MLLDNGTLALVAVVVVLGFLVWAGKQKAPGLGDPGGAAKLEERFASVERKLTELQRGLVRANAQAEEAKRIAEGVAPTLEQIRWMLERVTTDVTIIKAAQAGTDAAERAIAAQQRRADAGATTQFIGTNTLQGPTAGGNIGAIHRPEPHEQQRPHTI